MNILGVTTYLQHGSVNIGAIADRESLGRFSIGAPSVPLSVWCEFAGGAATAVMTAYIDMMDPENRWNTAIKTIGTVGTGTNASWLLTEDELPGYVIGAPTISLLGPPQLVIDWTNPAANTMSWELVVTIGRVA